MTRLLDMPSNSSTLGLMARKLLESASPVMDRVSGADVKKLRQKVLDHCLGDQVLAERFVQYELWRTPGISERDALRRALHSLERT